MKSNKSRIGTTPTTRSVILARQTPFEHQLSSIINNFIERTTQTIQLHQVLFKNNLPQRCLRHNNILTLYCEKDRLPICVSCMYHGVQHKNHKVIPLKNATKSLLTDTQNLENKMQRKIQTFEEVIRISTENLVKIERIYPEILNKIQINFKNLHNTLALKQDEQISYLFSITEKLRNEHIVTINQYKKLLHFFNQKNAYRVSDEENTNIFRLNSLAVLAQATQMHEVTVKPIQFLTYSQIFNSTTFKQIEQAIIQKCETKNFPEIVRINQLPKQSIIEQSNNKSRISSSPTKHKETKQETLMKNQEAVSRYPLEHTKTYNMNTSVNTSRLTPENKEEPKSSDRSRVKTPSHRQVKKYF